MNQIFKSIPFLLELVFNGSFILLYSLKKIGRIPPSWDLTFINNLLYYWSFGVALVVCFVLIFNFFKSKDVSHFLRLHVFSLFIFIALIIVLSDLELTFWFAAAHLFSSILSLYEPDIFTFGSLPTKVLLENKGLKNLRPKLFRLMQFRPAHFILLSFALVIFLGTLLLILPVSVKVDQAALSFYDALFMATSSICVTGLATINLVEVLSPFGHGVILSLVQIGGLGIMTLSSSMVILMGKSMSMNDQILMQGVLDLNSINDLFSMIVDIVKYTFFLELVGGLFLTTAFIFEDMEFFSALYHGMYHAISAFCNAGFSTFSDGPLRFSSNSFVIWTLFFLFVLGGLGFIVLRELKEIFLFKRKFTQLTLHAKIVLSATLILGLLGFCIIFFSEFLHALDAYTLWEKIEISLFHSFTTRSAGFYIISPSSFQTYTLYSMIFLMFIGAGPGSTAGGIKVTTVTILFQTIKAIVTGTKKVVLFHRTVSWNLIMKSVSVVFIAFIILGVFIFLLMLFESSFSFFNIVFEAVSAFSSTGITLGLSEKVSELGKLLLTVLMYIGRIGPLTLVLAIGQKNIFRGKVEYPEGRIIIG